MPWKSALNIIREVKKVGSTCNFSRMCNCGECGKEFFVPVINEWVYKRKDYMGSEKEETKFFCSWKCLRSFDREYEEKKRAKRLAKANG